MTKSRLSSVRDFKKQHEKQLQTPSIPEPTPPAPQQQRKQPPAPLLPPQRPSSQFPGHPDFHVKVQDFDFDEVELNKVNVFSSLFPSILFMTSPAHSYTCKFFITIRVIAQSLNISYIFAIMGRRCRLAQVGHAKTTIEFHCSSLTIESLTSCIISELSCKDN